MKHVMIDIETLGTTPGCMVPTIGLCPFSLEDGVGEAVEFAVSMADQLKYNLTVSDSTMSWWGQPDKAEARTLLTASFFGGLPIKEALTNVASYFKDQENTIAWSNGATFDLPILEYLYRLLGMPIPWAYNRGLCYRTLKTVVPSIPFIPPSIAHIAKEDAIAQAAHALAILQHLNDGKVEETNPAMDTGLWDQP